jgi:hypothetical protein
MYLHARDEQLHMMCVYVTQPPQSLALAQAKNAVQAVSRDYIVFCKVMRFYKVYVFPIILLAMFY